MDLFNVSYAVERSPRLSYFLGYRRIGDIDSNLIGFGQSNVLNGDFSCNVGLGYRIRNGEIVGRVKDTMIAGNIYELLGGNVELSSDTGYNGMTPCAVLEGISASTK